MSRIFLALVSLILIAALACGGGSGPRMTVEEYAAECASFGSKFVDQGFASGFGALEDNLAEIKEWNPPEELQEYHNAQIRGLEFSVDALQETGMLQLMQDIQKASEDEDQERFLELLGDLEELEGTTGELEAQIAELAEEVQRAEDDLSPAAREILTSAGCL